MQQVAIKAMNTEAIANLLTEAEIQQSVDTGSALVQVALHPALGNITLISNALDEQGVVMVSTNVAHLLPN